MEKRVHRIGVDRTLVLDIVRIARNVPSFPVERWFDLKDVMQARNQAHERISWLTLFAKAYGLASRKHPEVLRSYIAVPWPRYFQATSSVISVSVNRATESGDRLFFGRLRSPESLSLSEIQAELNRFTTEDVETVFRQQCLSARIPTPIRRLAWWWRMHGDVKKRARRVGTGSISVLAGFGVTNRLHPNILTSSLSYGPHDENGRMWVTLQCDHRVIDGAAAARVINSMHDYLCCDVLAELNSLPRSNQEAA